MADYITAIRTTDGDKQIDYNALANKPDLSLSGLGAAATGHKHSASDVTSGTLSVARGGTGKSSWTANRLMYPSASTTMAQLAFPTVNGSILFQNKTGAPYWDVPSNIDSYKVGDILVTTRADLGDNWLICNGDTVNRSDYTALCNTAGMMSDPASYSVSVSSDVEFEDMDYGDGKWVAVGDDGSYGYIYVWTDPTSAPTLALRELRYMMHGVAYGNGTWAAVSYNTNSDVFNIWHTTNPTGTWTKIDSPIAYDSAVISLGIRYLNGRWFVFNKTTIASATSLTDSWTSVTLSGTGSLVIQDIAYGNGYYVAVGTTTDSTSTTSGYTQIFTATSPTGTWTQNKSYATPADLSAVLYANNTWVAVGSHHTYGTNIYGTLILTASSNPTGTWTENVANRQGGNSADLYDLIYCNDTWVAAGGKITSYDCVFRTAVDPTGVWSWIGSDDDSGSDVFVGTTACPKCIAHDSSGVYLAAGYVNSETASYAYTNKVVKLPAISYPNAYAYIKAKES